ncbi:MAG: MFS transporter [Verrucomicrobiota bacterium]
MKDERRNFVAHSFEGGLYGGGIAFVSAETVLPAMAASLGAPAWVISLLPGANFLGLMVVPIFFAAFVESKPRMRPICIATGFPQRFVFFIAAMALFLFGESHPFWAMVVVSLTPFLSGIIGGIGLGAWMQLVARTVPAGRRSSMHALRNLITAVIGIGAAFFVKWTLERYPGAFGFGILHLAAFVTLFGSFLLFLVIKEDVPETPIVTKRRTAKSYLVDLMDILRQDKNFRYYTVMRLFGTAFMFQMPFMSIYALQKLETSEGFVGSLLTAQIIGSVIGNLIGGWWGDRAGGRVLLITARILFLVMYGLGAIASSEWLFLLYFGVFGFSFTLNTIGNLTLLLEIAPDERRPTYGALAGFINGPGLIIFSLVGSVFWTSLQSMGFQAGVAGVGSIISLIAIWMVVEPRTRSN